MIVGRGTPVDIARELDTKVDDSNPATGGLRAAMISGGAVTLGGASVWGGQDATCTLPAGTAPGINAIWDINSDSQDCNTVVLF